MRFAPAYARRDISNRSRRLLGEKISAKLRRAEGLTLLVFLILTRGFCKILVAKHAEAVCSEQGFFAVCD